MRGWGGPKEARKAIVDARQSYLKNKEEQSESKAG
jgi:hypothetical protein